MEHEHAEHVAAHPDQLFSVLADAGNLPHYVPQLRSVRATDGDHIEVEARYEGRTQRGEAWFRVDEGQRRIDWGTEGTPYHGWLQVEPDGSGSRLVMHLTTFHEGTRERELSGTLDAIRRLAERDM